MRRTIIADASCFIVLAKMAGPERLRLVYGEILTTPDVAVKFGEPLPKRIGITPSKIGTGSNC